MHRWILAVPLLALVLASCGSESATCRETREPQDPASGLHLLDLDQVTWQSKPPTSGPHLAAPTPRGVLLTPLDYAMQVTILEAGNAIIQYDESLTADEVASLESLASDGTVVAPGTDLPDRVVATAWTWKLTCGPVDVDGLTQFVSTRPADAPGSDF